MFEGIKAGKVLAQPRRLGRVETNSELCDCEALVDLTFLALGIRDSERVILTNNRRRHGWRCQSCPKRFTSFEHLGPLAGNHQPAALLFGFIRAIDADPFVTYEILGDELGIGTSVASTLRHKVLSLQVVLADRETRMREVPRLPKDFFRRIIRGPRADPAPRRRRQPANDWPAANRQAEEHQTL
jgi:hypothetical protein